MKKQNTLSNLQWWHGHFLSLSTGTVDSLETMATASAGPVWETPPGTGAEASALPAWKENMTPSYHLSLRQD